MHSLCAVNGIADARSTSHRLWGIVLAGGNTAGRARVRHRARRRRIPARVAARPILFRQSLSRAAHLIPEERLMAVLAREHASQYDGALGDLPGVHRVVQPSYRGSAAELFLAVLKIARRDRDAIVAVLPGDLPVDADARLMNHVLRAARAVTARPELPVVIGAHPPGPYAGRGWIEPGTLVEGLEAYAVRAVARFHPHPSPGEAAALYAGGALLNTQVVIARVAALIALGRRAVPDVLEALEPLEETFGEPEERLMSEAVYEAMPWGSLAHVLFARQEDIAVLPADVRVRHEPGEALAA
jgi:mannose-1-phosphate guanylyltransferase